MLVVSFWVNFGVDLGMDFGVDLGVDIRCEDLWVDFNVHIRCVYFNVKTSVVLHLVNLKKSKCPCIAASAWVDF